MTPEVVGALMLAARHLNSMTYDSKHPRRHQEKAQKHLARVAKFGGPSVRMRKDQWKRRWYVFVEI